MKIGITERGESSRNTSWVAWVKERKPAILITKDPQRLWDLFQKLKIDESYPVIVHCTITGLGGTVIEPNVPKAEESIKGYAKFKSVLNFRAVLRIDPIIPTERGVQNAFTILSLAEECSKINRIRISFLDNYSHVKERFRRAGIKPIQYDFHAPLYQREQALQELQSYLAQDIEVCGEPGMACTGCISKKDLDALGLANVTGKCQQRTACQCLAIKHELLPHRKRCSLGCLYCYWR
jgi:DNA repair photolyase